METSKKGLQIRSTRTSEGLVVTLSGLISDDVSFSSIALSPDDKVIIFDLEEIKLINSMGIRAWLIWMKESSKGRQFIFRKCSKVIIEQMNALSGFAPHGTIIDSLYVPYFCESCDQVDPFLYRIGKEYQVATADRPEQINHPEGLKCSKCGGSVEIDVLTGSFFRFLKLRSRG